MNRPPLAYRNVTFEDGYISGDYTTTEPLDVFPHGEWAHIRQPLEVWWVRLATADPETRAAFETLLGVADTGDINSAVRESNPRVRAAMLMFAQKITGHLMAASLLEVDASTLEAAVEDAFGRLRREAAAADS